MNWWPGAIWCSLGDDASYSGTEGEELVPSAWMKTKDMTGFQGDNVLAAEDAYDPEVIANHVEDVFLAAWESIDVEGMVFMYAPFNPDWFTVVSCYDWADVVGENGDFYSGYYFE